MPWKEVSVMDERLRFVARLLEGETMTDVCRNFGVSRKTGYKLFERYKEDGPVALPRLPGLMTASPKSNIPSMTATSSSPPAGESACITRRSTSPSSPCSYTPMGTSWCSAPLAHSTVGAVPVLCAVKFSPSLSIAHRRVAFE